MAKKIRAMLKVQAPAGAATAAPPVGPALGQHGINIMEFIKAFNERTADQRGYVVPAEITVEGSDWGGMCGTDFSQFAGDILLAVRLENDGRYVDPGCTPVASGDDIMLALSPLPEPNGSGPVAAVASSISSNTSSSWAIAGISVRSSARSASISATRASAPVSC